MNVVLLNDLDLPEVEIIKGEPILRKGDKGIKVYVLLSGCVDIKIGQHLLARESAPGTILGEISALLGTEIVATVTTTENSKFYVIEDFLPFLQEHVQIAVNVAQTLAYRLVYMNEHFVEIRNQITSINDQLSKYLPVFSTDSPDEEE